MPITPDEAADIARRHGLGLNDAAGLMNLANDADDAERIASRFAGTGPDEAREAELRAFAGHLFGNTPTDEPEATEPPPGNVVPREGDTPAIPDGGERVTRQFVADLFGHATRHDI